jgi:glycosyltransferase involved in cell wall biosynthesis
MYQLSVVITLNKHSKGVLSKFEQIRDALSAVQPDFELVIVSNESNMRAVDDVLTFKNLFPHVVFINLKNKCAEEEAMQLGLEYAQGDYIVLFADGFAYSINDIKMLFNAIKANNALLAVNGCHPNPSKGGSVSEQLKTYILQTIFGKYFDKGYFSTFKIVKRNIFYQSDRLKKTSLFSFFRKHPSRVGSITVKFRGGSGASANNFLILSIFPTSSLLLQWVVRLNVIFLFLWSMIAWFSLAETTYFFGVGTSLILIVLSYFSYYIISRQKAIIADIR